MPNKKLENGIIIMDGYCMIEQKDKYKTSRFLYIVEAALQYFISLLVIDAYLAKVATAIGLSDNVTGILASFVSLGCGFQIVAIFLKKRSVKSWVTILHSLNQFFFALIYLVPFFNIGKTGKAIFFVAFLLLGHIINNIVHSPKVNWYMSLVDDNKRGRFTANKEIVSLIGGMIFSFIMGTIIDHYEAVGNMQAAFIVCGLSIFGLMILHTLTLVFSKEKPCENVETVSTKAMLGGLIKDKGLFKVILVSILWNVANYTATPFYGTYQIKELGFSMTFVSLLASLHAICRATFSFPMGKFADKYSFKNMLNICFIIMVVAFSLNAFTVPSNGKVMYTIYYLLYAVGMAGISSATINLIYDYVPHEKRIAALALNGTMSGFAGFFASLIMGSLVAYIQGNGNNFLGMSVYAQQVVSMLASIITIVTLVYMNTALRNVEKNK